MASSQDVRDMLGLAVGGGAQKPAVQKRPKPSAASRRPQGVAREVAALYGERPPPVAVYEEKKTYRAKRTAGPAKKWIQQPFTNPSRSDHLVLKHWRRKPAMQPTLTNGEDMTMEDAENTEVPIEHNYDMARYNVQVDVPTFTDEEYNAFLRSNDWSREETDYLLHMVQEYYHRWAIIWDRYDFQPATAKVESSSQEIADGANDEENTLAMLPFAPTKSRTVEDLKARFYDICARLMKLRIPEAEMDTEQYQRYEILTKFDPVLEHNRKNLAVALMNRTIDEVKEEEHLLAEIQRINMAANRLDAERHELRERLEAPSQMANVPPGLASFTSSQALTTLFQQLFQADRSKKRASGSGGPGRLSLSTTDIIGTPTTAQHQLNSAVARRQSLAQQPAPTPIKQLSPQNEHRFNVSTHDRLTSGVTFGSDKLLKMRQAKSNVQTQKIAAALAQLGVSELIPIPTSKVGEVFEQLVGKVGKLLDVRKVREKEEGECKVLEVMKDKQQGKGQSERKESGEEMATAAEQAKDKEAPEIEETEETEVDADADGDEDAEGSADPDAEGEEDDADADAEADDDSQAQSTRQPSEAQSTKGHKRSASVLSQASNKSSKRTRR